jgi:hypothetical protein
VSLARSSTRARESRWYVMLVVQEMIGDILWGCELGELLGALVIVLPPGYNCVSPRGLIQILYVGLKPCLSFSQLIAHAYQACLTMLVSQVAQ